MRSELADRIDLLTEHISCTKQGLSRASINSRDDEKTTYQIARLSSLVTNSKDQILHSQTDYPCTGPLAISSVFHSKSFPKDIIGKRRARNADVFNN